MKHSSQIESPRIDQQLRCVLINTCPTLRLAILFGSLAKGTATPSSDLDLAVQMDQPLTVEIKMALIEALALEFGRPVDLIDLRVAGEPLVGEVFKGRRILGNNTTYGQRFAQHLRDVADFLPYRERILAARRKRWLNPS
ncbi:MAG: type VII toxin-antitoxin system MntA family adenylyltransferase antitoxin [bacterium]